MSAYSNRLQPALQNLLQRVVWFFLTPEIIMHDAYISERKSLIKPVTQQKTPQLYRDVQRITLII